MYKALIVDDDKLVLQTLKMLFESRKFDVVTAPSAEAGMSSLGDSDFDLVVTDMRMETETAGFDVLRKAKSLSNKPLVVILSAYPIPVTEWRDAGADAMYMKGGGAFRMIDEIERLLRSQAAKERSAS